MIMHLFHSNFRNLCQKWLLKINIAKPNFRTLFIYQTCSQFDGRYSYIQRYLRAKLGAYRTVCGISGVHNGEAAEFPIHTSLIHAVYAIGFHDALRDIGVGSKFGNFPSVVHFRRALAPNPWGILHCAP